MNKFTTSTAIPTRALKCPVEHFGELRFCLASGRPRPSFPRRQRDLCGNRQAHPARQRAPFLQHLEERSAAKETKTTYHK